MAIAIGHFFHTPPKKWSEAKKPNLVYKYTVLTLTGENVLGLSPLM